MNDILIDALHFKNHRELEPYFNLFPFNSITISDNSKTATMMDSGYISNLAIKFWRLLESKKLLETKKGDSNYCDFLLEIFLNQALSCTDTLSTSINHFLRMRLSGQKLAIQNDDFMKILKEKISSFPDIIRLENANKWVKEKLYPYRNIVHHMGESSGYVQMGADFTIECCLVLKEDQWDFLEIRKNLRSYPSHTAWLIDTNTINLPNLITGSTGDANKYVRIDVFFDEWINKIYELVKIFISAQIWYQTNEL